jgi:hypothetical protein
LRAVADLVASVTDEPATLAAAWLHDTVEDTPATFEDIEREFGADVAGLVKELTDVSGPADGGRAARKAVDRRHTAASSPRAKTIKLADLIDNCEDICRHDEKFGRVYLGEAKALLGVLREGEARLYARAVEVLDRWEVRLGLAPSAGPDDAGQESKSPWPGSAPSGRRGIRLFMEAFSARDIQEPLPSYDAETIERLSPGEWPWPGRAIVGVRSEGEAIGYLLHGEWGEGGRQGVRDIDRRQRVPLDAPLTDVIHVLTHFEWCFVELDGAVVGVIGRGHIEKPIVRMWLFGIIILIEMHVVNLIRLKWPAERWAPLVSEGRLEKARQLQDERARRGLPADLLDCLQFADKLQIAVRDPSFLESAGFGSLGAAKKVIKEIEALRNNLAHGQDVTSHDWPQIARLARRVQQLHGG